MSFLSDDDNRKPTRPTFDGDVPVSLLVRIDRDVLDVAFVQRLVHIPERQGSSLGLGRRGTIDVPVPSHVESEQRFRPSARPGQRHPPGRRSRHRQALETQTHQTAQGGIDQSGGHGVDHPERLALDAESAESDGIRP